MKRPKKSIFEMKTPPMGRVIGANAVIWIMSIGLLWQALSINNAPDIPVSARYDTPLSPELASLLAAISFICAIWSSLLIKKSYWRAWTAWVRIGLLSAIAGIFLLGVAITVAAYRISEIYYLGRQEMKLGRLNHIGVATPSIAESVFFYRDVALALARPEHYNDLVM